MKTNSISPLAVAAAVAIICGTTLTAPAQAQVPTDNTFQSLSMSVSDFHRFAVPGTALANANSAWWKAVREENVRALKATDTRAQSLQNIIYLATHYPEQSKFGTSEIYEVYRFDQDERIRVMALAALHAIGHEDTMRQLARDIQLEASPRIRRLTTGAVNDYFKGTQK